jgi:hypothetical protein
MDTEKRREQKRQWKLNNKDKVQESAKIYYLKNRERLLLYQREYKRYKQLPWWKKLWIKIKSIL